MQERSKIHVGLDVHKDSISVAAAEPGRAPGRLIGKVTHDVNKLLKVLARIGIAEQLHLVYEAGPTGSDYNAPSRPRATSARSLHPLRSRSDLACGSRPLGATACNWPSDRAGQLSAV